MTTIKDIYNSVSKYTITDDVQSIPFEFDYQRLLKEILDFVDHNKYGYFVTSLKLNRPNADLTDYNHFNEVLQHNAKGIANWYHVNTDIVDDRNNNEYTHWHPDLENSYVKELSNQIEELSGFKIGQIKLAWLLPDAGYSMHADTEALRFHIPLLTNDFAYFLINDKIYHMDPGHLYHLQTTEYHSAFNLGPLPRLHLVFCAGTWPELDLAVKEKISNVRIANELITKLKEQNYSPKLVAQLSKIFADSGTQTGQTFSQLFAHLSQSIK